MTAQEKPVTSLEIAIFWNGKEVSHFKEMIKT
jgi:hypothetical protein